MDCDDRSREKTSNKRGELRRLLSGYRPQDRGEAEDLARLEALLETADDPFSRHCFAPGHVTVSAFVRSPRGRELLMIHHGRLARWLQPGGHVEESDPDLLAGAIREVAEETGLASVTPDASGAFDVDVHPIPARTGEPAHLHFDMRFALRAGSPTLRPASEVRGARWVAFDDVATLCPESSMARVLRKLRRLAGA